MEEKISGWQAFEIANKYYLILIGIVFISIGILYLIIFGSDNWIGILLTIMLGILSIGLGVISKPSRKE